MTDKEIHTKEIHVNNISTIVYETHKQTGTVENEVVYIQVSDKNIQDAEKTLYNILDRMKDES